MQASWQELRRAFRSLAKAPRFTAMTIATLALGIGAATAIFSVVHAVLMRPLPLPDADRVVRVWQVNEGGSGRANFSDPNFEDLRERARGFSVLAHYGSSVESVAGGSEPVRLTTAWVSEDFFRALGVSPLVGRAFVDEEQNGGVPAAIVSYGYWQRYLGGARDLAAIDLRLLHRSHSIVGVMPPGIDFPADTDLFVPRQRLYELTGEDVSREASRTAHNWRVFGRLADGVTLEQARLDASEIARELKSRYGEDTWMVDVNVLPLHEALVGEARPALSVLAGAVGFLLLVACANVVNLLLARAASRHKELAVSAALGASRWDLTRPVLAETLLLSLAGGAAGVVLAKFGIEALLAFEPGRLPRAATIEVSLPVVAFALGLSVSIALGLGLVSAMRSWGADLHESLRERRHAGSSGRLHRWVVVAQVALTLVLLVGAGLLGRSLLRLLDVDPGFRTRGAIVMDLAHPYPSTDADKARLSQLQSALLDRLRSLPEVVRAGGLDRPPMGAGSRNGLFVEMSPGERVEGIEDFQRLFQDSSRVGEAEYRAATEGYFQTLSIPLLRGRTFEMRDGLDAPHVAVISQSLAETQWPDEDPMGKLIEFGNMDGDLRLLRVIGVVGDVHDEGLDAAVAPTIYVNARQRPPSTLSIVMETTSPAASPSAIASARAIVRELAPDVPPRFATIEDVVTGSFADRRFTLVLIGAFAAAALGLAVLGVYGVIALGVAERVRELGIRIALGARQVDVVGLIAGQGMRLVAVGVAIGLIAAIALTSFLESLLFEVTPTDPMTFASLAIVLVTAAFAACYFPARRAARCDPTAAMRED